MTRRELLSAFALLPALGKSEESCNGQIIASGRLSSADHEDAEGYFSIGEATLMLHPDGVPIQIVRALKGSGVELVIREVMPREPKRLDR